MLSKENVSDALTAARGSFPDTTEQDIAFLALCDIIADKSLAFNCVYSTYKSAEEVQSYLGSPKIENLSNILKSFGIGNGDKNSLSREENQSALIKMLAQIESAMDNHEIERGQALKMMADIRVKLQDKFDMDEDKDEAKHLIVVPQKHDLICPHTNRECMQMPSKEACMEYWGLCTIDGVTVERTDRPKSRKIPKRPPSDDLVLDVERH